MTDPVPNVELLKRVRKHIDRHPDKWDQYTYRDVYECGTVMCFAGWAVQLSGGRWIDDTDLIHADSRDGPDTYTMVPSAVHANCQSNTCTWPHPRRG